MVCKLRGVCKHGSSTVRWGSLQIYDSKHDIILRGTGAHWAVYVSSCTTCFSPGIVVCMHELS